MYSDVFKAEAGDDSSAVDDLSPTEGLPDLELTSDLFHWEGLDLDQVSFGDILPTPVEDVDDAAVPSPEPTGSDLATLTHTTELMTQYGLTDDQLSDMPLKQLKRWCGADENDYRALKSYRRTCLNRNYARSSRSKQNEKAQTLTAQLRDANERVRRLEQQVQEKDLRIEYLQLENRLLQDFSRDN